MNHVPLTPPNAEVYALELRPVVTGVVSAQRDANRNAPSLLYTSNDLTSIVLISCTSVLSFTLMLKDRIGHPSIPSATSPPTYCSRTLSSQA